MRIYFIILGLLTSWSLTQGAVLVDHHLYDNRWAGLDTDLPRFQVDLQTRVEISTESARKIEWDIDITPFSQQLQPSWTQYRHPAVISEESLEHMRARVAAEPLNPDRRLLLGESYATRGEIDRAAHQFWLAARLSPNNVRFASRLAYALLRLGDHQRALRLYDAIINHVDATPSSHFNRGAAFYYLGRYEESLAVWQDYLTHHPDDEAARFNLGATLVAQERWTEGLDILRDFEMRFLPLPVLLAALHRPLVALDRNADADNIRRLITQTTERNLAEELLSADVPRILFKE